MKSNLYFQGFKKSSVYNIGCLTSEIKNIDHFHFLWSAMLKMCILVLTSPIFFPSIKNLRKMLSSVRGLCPDDDVIMEQEQQQLLR